MESETLQVEKNCKNLEARKVMVYSKNSKKQKNGETKTKRKEESFQVGLEREVRARMQGFRPHQLSDFVQWES